MQSSSKIRGFTLVELSVVLVIIGLVVGSVVIGKSLIRQTELLSILSEAKSYDAAWKAFKLQYRAWPGDFNKATQYWPDSGDGNGNKILEIPNDGEEYLLAWQHLALADITPGTYTGVVNDEQPYAKIGLNMPGSKVDGAGWTMISPSSGHDLFGIGGTGTALLLFGKEHNDYWPEGPVVSSREGMALDQKADDGIPNKGMIMIRRGWVDDGSEEVDGCVDQESLVSASTTVNYVLSDELTCQVNFWLER